MNKIFLIVFIIFNFLNAKDLIFYHDIKEALNSKFAKQYLKNDVEFDFYNNKTLDDEQLKISKATSRYRKIYDTLKKEHVLLDKDYKTSCQYAFIAVLKAFEEKAKTENKVKVINLQGNFKNQLHNSKDKFQCAVGKFVTTVSLQGNLK